MARNIFRRGALGALLAATLVVAIAAPVVAYHTYNGGWRDKHLGYPGTPDGHAAIVNRFGQPCSNDARFNRINLRAADDGVTYAVYFHKRLGGKYPDRGGGSTNLDNDVKGHIYNEHLEKYLLHGIYGYNCRYMRGGSKWSTHAWGIAVDVSSAVEPNGQCHSKVNHHHWPIWREHRWKWGLSWCDAMHFQYATGY